MSDTVFHILTVIGIIIIAFTITRLLKLLLTFNFKKSTGGASMKKKSTSINFSYHALSAITYIIACVFIYQLTPELHPFGKNIFAGAGILTVVIGFASQAALSNIVGGIFIVLFKPFRIGDIITVATFSGEIQDITLRHTVIKSFENKRIIIPNSVISSESIINSTIEDQKILNFFEFTVPHSVDVRRVIDIVRELALNHELTIDNRTPEELTESKEIVNIRVRSWTDVGPTIRALIWSENLGNGLIIKNDLFIQLREKFIEEGMEFPYQIRVVKNVESA